MFLLLLPSSSSFSSSSPSSSSSSSDDLVQNCVTLMIIFAQYSSISDWAVHQPITFSQFWSLTRSFEPATEELWLISNAIFKKLNFRRTHNHLAIKQLLFKIAELEIRLCAWRRESLWHPLLTQCLKRSWSMILQPILHTSTEEAYENRLAARW